MEQIEIKNFSVTFVSVIPDLISGQGHPYSYHQAVEKAANLINWKYIALTAPDPYIKELPNNWTACLKGNLELQVHPIIKIFRLITIYNWADSLAKELRQRAILKSDYSIIFLERFIALQLLGLLVALLLVPRNSLFVWLFYRRDTHKQKIRFIYKILNKLIINFLPESRVKIFTDSEILAKSLSNYFQATVTVMPIPHTNIDYDQVLLRKIDEIICWFAGSPRLEKGVEVVRKLASMVTPESQQIKIIIAKSSGIRSIVNGAKIHLIEDSLTRNEYLKWLHISDIVLLPYDSYAYSERTSGVFVECIIAGKLSVVTKGTWMAAELSKYGLHELILDWQDDLVLNNLVTIANDNTIKTKVIKMQQAYRKFHNIQTYAEIMESSFQEYLL